MKGQTNQAILTAKLQRNLRNNMTDAEQALWQCLRNRQMAGFKFRRQHPYENYILDFVSLDAKLVIEIDGGQHASHSEHDKARDTSLVGAGFKVLRFWNNQVLQEMDAVLEAIWQALSTQAPTSPNPLPASPLKGEGSTLPPLQGEGWGGDGLSTITKNTITGIVLAGGLGRRMGGLDKGLLPFRGKPLVAHVLERLRPQVDDLLLNANREIAAYQAFGYPVVSDTIGGFAGPLAGLHCGMLAARTPLVASVPCDAPLLPADLVPRLLLGLEQRQADLAVAKTGDWSQPVFCLCRASLLPNLTRFLESGGRKVDAWHAGLKMIEVAFDDETEAFANFNTPEQLEAAA